MRRESLSLAQARRIAIAAQGLGKPRRTSTPTVRSIQSVIDRTGVVQIDSISIVARAHLFPFFSRLGPYDEHLVIRASEKAPRRLVECWGHAASFVPPEVYRLLAWRRRSPVTAARWQHAIEGLPVPMFAEIVRIVRDHGPITATEIEAALGRAEPRRRDQWGWNWSSAKTASEYLFAVGELMAAGRTAAFERRYDLPERVIAEPNGDMEEAHACRELVDRSARALGVATVGWLADYYRLPVRRTACAVAELVEDGRLIPVTVAGWSKPAYRHRSITSVPRSVTGRALLAPFDPMVFERSRLHALFGMHYRVEIYTPAAQRVHGYYVLPFLLGDVMAARVDMAADRRASVLRVPAAYLEPGAPAETAHALAAELRDLATWLGLSEIAVPAGRSVLGDQLAGLLAA